MVSFTGARIYRRAESGWAGVNWVDLIVLAVLAVSALLAFMRGLVREVLGIGSWIGAGLFAAWAAPQLRDRVAGWIGPDYAEIAAFGGSFLVAVILLSVVAGMVGGVVRVSLLGGLDRTLGMVFGLLRGVWLIAVAYIALSVVLPVDRWPPAVQQARALPYAYRAAVLFANLLPREYRPTVGTPPAGRETKAEDLLRTNPQGRAIARP
jgi:membrane protein required for colicin V production